MSLAVLLLTAALCFLALRGSPRTVLAILLGVVTLVPATLLLPGSPTALLTVPRAVEGAALLGFLLQARLVERRVRPRAPLALLVLAGYLGVVAVTGVGLADPGLNSVAAAYAWVGQAEQALVLALVLGLARRTTSAQVLQLLALAAAAVLVVYALEALTGGSYARLLFRGSPEQLGTGPASVLEQRDGHLRVRGAADFALAGGWVLTALLPAVCVLVPVFVRRGWRLAAVGATALVPLLIGGVILTRSRSPLVLALAVVALLVVVLAPRRPVALLTSAALLVGTAAAAGPTLGAQISPDVDSGSIDVRLERLPDVLALAAPEPLTGVGLTGISRVGLAGVDSSYVQVYVESGALALTLLLLALGVAVLAVLRGLWSGRVDDPDDRLLVLASGVALMSLLLSAGTFDTFNELGTARLFWLLCAVGIAAAERSGAVPVRRSLRVLLSPARWGLVMAAVTVGLLVRSLTPTHAAAELVFATLSPATEALDDPPGLGRTLVVTTCALAERAARDAEVEVTVCAEQGPPGWGRMRIEADDPLTAARGVRSVLASTGAVPALRFVRVAELAAGPVVGTPSLAAVAPQVGGVLGLGVLLLVPSYRRRES